MGGKVNTMISPWSGTSCVSICFQGRLQVLGWGLRASTWLLEVSTGVEEGR